MATDAPYYVYVLKNTKGRFYIGISENTSKRVSNHNSGVSKWTKHRGPWKLVWNSDPVALSEARKLENILKRSKGGNQLYAITGLTRSSSGS